MSVNKNAKGHRVERGLRGRSKESERDPGRNMVTSTYPLKTAIDDKIFMMIIKT